MIEKYGVNYFKFDGVGGGNTEPGKPYAALGPEATADLEALLRLTADLRRVRPTVFINITTGTWPSPFWLLYGDSIWRNGQRHGLQRRRLEAAAVDQLPRRRHPADGRRSRAALPVEFDHEPGHHLRQRGRRRWATT